MRLFVEKHGYTTNFRIQIQTFPKILKGFFLGHSVLLSYLNTKTLHFEYTEICKLIASYD